MKVLAVRPSLPRFEDVADTFAELLQSGQVTNFGRYMIQLENEISDLLGANVAAVNSGTTGLILSLQALGLPRGGKVIIPSYTFPATGQAVLYAGGTPVFAEIDEQLTLCPQDLVYLLDRHEDIHAVLPVHTFGTPCRVDEICGIVGATSQKRSRPIRLVYDAAHAFGSACGNRMIGTFGDAEVFSTSFSKIFSTIEGGIITSRDANLIELIRKMRNYGMGKRRETICSGLNGKMTEFHAVIGLANLGQFENRLTERRRKARYYLDRLKNLPDLTIPACYESRSHVFKNIVILVADHRRDELKEYLNFSGVQTREYFNTPLHTHEFFSSFVDRDLCQTESISKRAIILPFFTDISETEIDFVVDTLAEACG